MAKTKGLVGNILEGLKEFAIPLDSVNLDPDNARNHGPDSIQAIKRSLKQFGQDQLIVVQRDGMRVRKGNGRVVAARELGWSHIAAVIVDEADVAAAARAIADNRSAEFATWNIQKLFRIWNDVNDENDKLGVAMGFSKTSLAKFVQAGGHSIEELESERTAPVRISDPEAVPAPPAEAETKVGDIWVLGKHRLMCGDSSSPEDLDKLLAGAVVHLTNTDPPYNVAILSRSNIAIAAGMSDAPESGRHPSQNGRGSARGRTVRAKDRPLANDSMSDEEYQKKKLISWFTNIARVSAPGASFYIWGGFSNCESYPPAFKASGLRFSQAIIWVKDHPVLSRKDFNTNHEWCQPEDAKILTLDGTSAFGAIRDGDRVPSFSRLTSSLVGLKQGFSVRYGKRFYQGDLYGVAAGRNLSWGTDGHKWSVKIHPDAHEQWCVYLMRRGNWWRIGKTKVYTSWGFGLKQRLIAERGDAAWILSVHTSSSEALCHEQMLSVKYGIPMTFWEEVSGQSKRTIDQIRWIYSNLNLEEMKHSALRLLSAFGRRMEYPLLLEKGRRIKVSRRVSMIVESCNLIPGIMLVPVPTKRFDKPCEWTPISHIDRQAYSGLVCSMDVEDFQHYVADGIVTHNCFYGWLENGSHRFFGPANAQDVWRLSRSVSGSVLLGRGVRLKMADGARLEVRPAGIDTTIRDVAIDGAEATVYGSDPKSDVWTVKKLPSQEMVHLTQKPVELAVRAITYSSLAGENVLDLFGGSGSTLIACEQTERRNFSMELDPLYCDTIRKRWEEFTGKKAKLVRK